MSDLFLSYSRADKPIAEAIAGELQKLGVEVWWDHELAGGDDFRREITERLERVTAAVVLWSRHSVESRWVINEAAAASEKRLLIPITIDKSTPPIDFRSLHTIDLSDWVAGDPLPAGFLKAVGDRIGRTLAYSGANQETSGLGRMARQVTQTWWFDFEAILFYLIGQALACFLCNISVAAIAHDPAAASGANLFYEKWMGFAFSVLSGVMISALYMRPLLETRRFHVAAPLFLTATLLSVGAYAVAVGFVDRLGARAIQYVGPATVMLLLVTAIANKAARRT